LPASIIKRTEREGFVEKKGGTKGGLQREGRQLDKGGGFGVLTRKVFKGEKKKKKGNHERRHGRRKERKKHIAGTSKEARAVKKKRRGSREGKKIGRKKKLTTGEGAAPFKNGWRRVRVWVPGIKERNVERGEGLFGVEKMMGEGGLRKGRRKERRCKEKGYFATNV